MVKNEISKLKALSDIASIDISLPFDDILRRILNITCKTMSAHSGTIMLVDESGELRMVASFGLPDNYIELINNIAAEAGVKISSSPSGVVQKTGNYYVVPDLFNEPKNKPWWKIAKEFGFSAQIFTPMKKGEKVIGLLNVYMEKSHDFTDQEINFVMIAASQASSVVQNAKLCIRLEDNIHELKGYKERLEEKIEKTHQELYDSEKYLRTIFNASFDGILVIDENGCFEFCNDSTYNILGWPRNELLGQSFMKVIPDEMHEFMTERWNEIQNGMEMPFETKIVTKNGENRYLHISNAKTAIKGMTKYSLIIKDITKYKELELDLKRSEKKLRELFDNADDSIYTHDMNGYFLDVNQRGLNELGATRDEVIGTNISKWLTPECFKQFRERVSKIYNNEQLEQPVLIEVIRKDGEHRWGEVRTSLIKDGDNVIGIHGIARDITERKKLENQLMRYHKQLENSYQELKEADRIKTEFVSNISHELLTPLTSIKGFAELIHDGTTGRINEEQRKSVETIMRNSDRLIHLIKELLDTANLDKNKLGLQFELVSMNDIISRSVADMHPQAKVKEIAISHDLPRLPYIWGDRERLLQVMTNILGNAIKFTPAGGRITVTGYESAKYLNINIADTGIGIPQDKLDLIFERFYQIDSGSRRKYAGVGLGLSICKTIIEKHYGSIKATSNGNGSKFRITLPKLIPSQVLTYENQGV